MAFVEYHFTTAWWRNKHKIYNNLYSEHSTHTENIKQTLFSNELWPINMIENKK